MRMSGVHAWSAMGLTAAALLASGAGCPASGGPGRLGGHRPTHGATRVLRNVDVGAVRPVADRAFRQHFRIDADTSSGSVLVARPHELTEPARPERVKDVLRPSPNRRRQLAELHLTQEGPHVLVWCVVQTQRLDTTERAAFARVRGDDRPTDTPIDRQGASSGNLQEEWVTVGRDRGIEQEILAAIQRDLAAASQAAG